MKKSSNSKAKVAPQSDSQNTGKDQAYSTRAAKLKARKVNRQISAIRIQRAWFAYVDRTIFHLLKQTICAAEQYVSHELLKNISPSEADLVKDPSMKCKVRFRFSGVKFPPFIVFKIFLQNEGHGHKYFNGKDLLKPSSEALADAYKMMGRRKFCQQIKEEQRCFQKFKVADLMDVVTMRDYLQYCKLVDDSPASSGGKNNCWRRLNLKSIPRSMMMYDILAYAESGVISSRLQKERKYLLQKPQTEEMLQQQLQVIYEYRLPPITTVAPFYQPPQLQKKMKHLGRRSKQAQKKVEKMRKVYIRAKEEMSTCLAVEPKPDIPQPKLKVKSVFRTSSFEIFAVREATKDGRFEEDEEEEEYNSDDELFAWCEDLCFEQLSLF
uniref:putative uncharacterized protein CXorf58 homolog n=1 Tax=Jaculus jaculus TaxID=51337 RepID=UPI001E1B2D67|nr:putative uncharacterized protein CXorf58 homolog [Jaculus jaculus]